jgi:hypothetical protein
MAGGNCCVRSYCASNGRMDRQSAHEGLRLRANPSLPDPGSRWCIRRDIYPPRSIDRHSRPPDVSAFTLAKRIRRTVDRLDPQGMPRPYRGVRRTPSARLTRDIRSQICNSSVVLPGARTFAPRSSGHRILNSTHRQFPGNSGDRHRRHDRAAIAPSRDLVPMAGECAAQARVLWMKIKASRSFFFNLA